MPFWTPAEEKMLAEMLSRAMCLEELAKVLKRSPEAVAMKLKRMGLAVPEKSSVKNFVDKVTVGATTTTPRLEPVEAAELPSANEMMGLLVAAIRRLQASDVSAAETKKLRLIIQAAKSYINLEAGVVLRLRQMESNMLFEYRCLELQFQRLVAAAKSPEEKAEYEETLRRIKQSIKEMVEAGIREPRKVREELPS